MVFVICECARDSSVLLSVHSLMWSTVHTSISDSTDFDTAAGIKLYLITTGSIPGAVSKSVKSGIGY